MQVTAQRRGAPDRSRAGNFRSNGPPHVPRSDSTNPRRGDPDRSNAGSARQLDRRAETRNRLREQHGFDFDRLAIPSGPTADRPSSPLDGELRSNSTTGLTEHWDGTVWISAADAVELTEDVADLSAHLAAADDHTQYSLVDGTRAFTGDVAIAIDDAVDDGVTQALRLTHTTSGTPAVGIGVGLEFEVETTAGSEVGGAIEFAATDVDSGTEDFDLVIRSMAGGAPASESLRLTSEGVLSIGDFRMFQDADVNFFLGENAGNLSQVGAIQNIGIGQLSLGDLTSGDNNTGIGYQSLRGLTTGSGNVGIGAGSMSFLTTGSNNVAIGLNALPAVTTGGRNIGVGEGALFSVTEADANTAVGRSSLQSLTTADNCTAFGNTALLSATGERNTAVGSTAGQSTTTGTHNTYVGVGAGFQTGSGTRNVAIGDAALFYNVGGINNVCLGHQAGLGTSADAINRNICIGYEAGHDLQTSGDNNIFIGYRAGDGTTSGDTNIVIGYNIDTPSATSSQTMTIGNLIFAEDLDGTGTTISTGNVGIGIASATEKLHVVGDILCTVDIHATNDVLPGNDLTAGNDVTAGNNVIAANIFTAQGSDGIDKVFEFTDAVAATHSVTIVGGIITIWDIV